MSSVKCNICKELIHSLYEHDFNRCSCGETFIDGGDLPRIGWKTVEPTEVIK